VAGSSLGFKHSIETKTKMSQIKKLDLNLNVRKKGKDSLNWGKKRSEEFKINHSLKMQGINNPNFGKKTSLETKLIISKALSKPAAKCF
jgi:hypothetical protein